MGIDCVPISLRAVRFSSTLQCKPTTACLPVSFLSGIGKCAMDQASADGQSPSNCGKWGSVKENMANAMITTVTLFMSTCTSWTPTLIRALAHGHTPPPCSEKKKGANDIAKRYLPFWMIETRNKRVSSKITNMAVDGHPLTIVINGHQDEAGPM